MVRLNEIALRRLIKGGETTTVEFKVAALRPVEMAERLCAMANAQREVGREGLEPSRPCGQEILSLFNNPIASTGCFTRFQGLPGQETL